MPWLLTVTQITWVKQKIINDLISKYKNHDVTVELIEDGIDWNFADSMDFLRNGLQDMYFNHWLFPSRACPMNDLG